MKHLFLILSALMALSYGFKAWAADEDEPTKQANLPKAVLVADKDKGFKISDSAIKRLQIGYQILKDSNVTKIPSDSIVYHESEAGVYIFTDGWFKLVDVEVEKVEGKEVIVKSPLLIRGSQIVVHGVPLLRVAELDAFGGTRDMD